MMKTLKKILSFITVRVYVQIEYINGEEAYWVMRSWVGLHWKVSGAGPFGRTRPYRVRQNAKDKVVSLCLYPY